LKTPSARRPSAFTISNGGVSTAITFPFVVRRRPFVFAAVKAGEEPQ